MTPNHPEPSPDAEKPVAGQPEGKALRLYRRCYNCRDWEVGYLDKNLVWVLISVHATSREAAAEACRLNGHEPEVDGGELFGPEVEER
jgi:hypothetical protein